MLDGYFREAVSNFAASIERFHEFSIEIFNQNLLSTVNTEAPIYHSWTQLDKNSEYDKAWKIISNQLERQLGAYTMLYLSVFKRAPELIKNKNVEFRNKVIHKGYFPTEQETLKYAVDIFSYLQYKLIELTRLRGLDSSRLPIWSEVGIETCADLVMQNKESITTFLTNLSNADLDQLISYTNSKGKVFENSVRDILTHVALHGQHHRGQINSRLRAAGFEPVNIDFITFVR